MSPSVWAGRMRAGAAGNDRRVRTEGTTCVAVCASASALGSASSTAVSESRSSFVATYSTGSTSGARSGRFVQHLLDQPLRVGQVERMAARDQLVGDHAERPQVHVRAGRPIEQHVGSHVGKRTDLAGGGATAGHCEAESSSLTRPFTTSTFAASGRGGDLPAAQVRRAPDRTCSSTASATRPADGGGGGAAGRIGVEGAARA